MGKKKTASAPWMVFLEGTLLSVGCYLAGLLLLALLAVRGTVPESALFPLTAALCLVSSAGGSLLPACRGSGLPPALLNAAIFTALLLFLGMACWQRITWNGHGGILILCALAGGILAGCFAGRRPRRRKKRK